MDSDGQELYSETLGRPWARDIVHFVPFDTYKNDPKAIARETLAEVPRQVKKKTLNNEYQD